MPSVFRGLPAQALAPSAVTIGNFDGVHRGHRELFRRLIEAARVRQAKPTVLTFHPHPARIVAPERAPKLLSSLEDRIAAIADCGIEQIVVIPFDAELARLTPEQFVAEILVRRAGVRVVLVGENFRFGHRQAGDTAQLRELGRKHGFDVEAVGGVTLRGRMISSTEIRRDVEAGQVARAGRLLGRAFSLGGAVVSGHGIGRSQTVPTLNLAVESEVLPARGVYVTRTHDLDDGREWTSITNVGVRPTFGGGELTVETFLLEALEPPDPRRIRVDFGLRLRDERKFEDAAALRAQIARDARRAAAYHRRARRWVG